MSDELVELSSELVTSAARLVRAVRRRHDLPAGLRVLALLEEGGPEGITRLAEADRCSQPTMSAIVRGLTESGWVARARDPADARASVVELTAAGRSELARARRLNGEVVAARLEATGHDAAEVATAVAVLRSLLDRSDPEAPHL